MEMLKLFPVLMDLCFSCVSICTLYMLKLKYRCIPCHNGFAFYHSLHFFIPGNSFALTSTLSDIDDVFIAFFLLILYWDTFFPIQKTSNLYGFKRSVINDM